MQWMRWKPGLDVTLVDQSPPKLGGVPSRSEGGAVCSKTRSDLIDFREALLISFGALREYLKGCYAALNRPPQSSLRDGIPA